MMRRSLLNSVDWARQRCKVGTFAQPNPYQVALLTQPNPPLLNPAKECPRYSRWAFSWVLSPRAAEARSYQDRIVP